MRPRQEHAAAGARPVVVEVHGHGFGHREVRDEQADELQEKHQPPTLLAKTSEKLRQERAAQDQLPEKDAHVESEGRRPAFGPRGDQGTPLFVRRRGPGKP